MVALSILFDRPDERMRAQRAEMPDSFVDLNLDQIVDAVTADWTEFELKPFLYHSLDRTESIHYRHEIFRDLESAALFDSVRAFTKCMADVRGHIAQAGKLYYQRQKQAWFLRAVEIYCEGVARFSDHLRAASATSRGFRSFRNYFSTYAASQPFTSLVAQTTALRDDLSNVRYSIRIKGDSFTVRNYENEPDYSAEIDDTFAKFKQGAAIDYRATYRPSPDMNHIEAQVLDFVAQLNSELFGRLDDYCARHADFIDETIASFGREIHFYIAYLEYVAQFRRTGLTFCYPRVSSQSKAEHDYAAFDLALAQKLIAEDAPIVCNDFFLKDRERIIVVSGPNQGGKTTFARMFGQLHYLASLGCPVPGRDAQLFLFDHLFTHFEREEKVENLRGKLEDDLVRTHAILERATPRSIIVMNEVFTSTTLQDEIFLSRSVMGLLSKLDLLCVWVTFVDELATFSEKTVSMVSTIVPEDPALRTFKVVRRPADGLAYAMAIAEKYGLTYDRVKERIAS